MRESSGTRAQGRRSEWDAHQRTVEDFSLEGVLREWVLPKGSCGESRGTKASLRRLPLERETTAREDEANRVNSEGGPREVVRRMRAAIDQEA